MDDDDTFLHVDKENVTVSEADFNQLMESFDCGGLSPHKVCVFSYLPKYDSDYTK